MKKRGIEKSLEEIRKESKEPEGAPLIKSAKISDDKKSLLIRIPQEMRNKFNMKAWDKIVFEGIFADNKKPELKISFQKNVR